VRIIKRARPRPNDVSRRSVHIWLSSHGTTSETAYVIGIAASLALGAAYRYKTHHGGQAENTLSTISDLIGDLRPSAGWQAKQLHHVVVLGEA
jgi:hypothetical protein